HACSSVVARYSTVTTHSFTLSLHDALPIMNSDNKKPLGVSTGSSNREIAERRADCIVEQCLQTRNRCMKSYWVVPAVPPSTKSLNEEPLAHSSSSLKKRFTERRATGVVQQFLKSQK